MTRSRKLPTSIDGHAPDRPDSQISSPLAAEVEELAASRKELEHVVAARRLDQVRLRQSQLALAANRAAREALAGHLRDLQVGDPDLEKKISSLWRIIDAWKMQTDILELQPLGDETSRVSSSRTGSPSLPSASSVLDEGPSKSPMEWREDHWKGAAPAWGEGDSAPLHARTTSDLVYVSNENALFEVSLSEERVRLQISLADYRQLAAALGHIKNKPRFHYGKMGQMVIFTVKDLFESHLQRGERIVPMTQAYLAIRFWKWSGLVHKQGGRSYELDFGARVGRAPLEDCWEEVRAAAASRKDALASVLRRNSPG